MASLPDDAVRSCGDDVLMARVGDGDSVAFDELVRRHQAWVLRLALRYLGDLARAEDAAQNAFIQLHGASPRYRACGMFIPYLRRLVLNQCHMEARAQRNYRKAVDRSSETNERVAELSQHADARQVVRLALSQLSDKHREVVILRFIAELTLPEIAEEIAIPLGTVKSRLFEAMAQLKDVVARIV